MMKTLHAALCGLAVLAGMAPAALAQTPEAFYAGKRLKVIVGTPPGGGYDLYSRLLARHIGRHIPGQPMAFVVNMPGAASVSAANYLANVGPQDGTETLTVVQTLPMAQLTRSIGARFDLARFNWLGSMSDDANVFIAWHSANVHSIQDAQERPLIVGATNAASVGGMYPAIMNKFMGTKFKIVLGYKSGEAIDLALEGGEIEGRAGASWSSLKALRGHRLRDHEIDVFLQIGRRKEPDLADVPLLIDLARDETERKVLQFYSSLTAVARAVAVGPGVPAERVAVLREAFAATMRDPELLADAERLGLEIRPVPGDELQGIVTDMVHTDPAILQLDEILGGKQ